LVQEVAAEVQSIAHAKISVVVTRCLSAVFEKPYEFKITFERKRNKTEAKITFCKDGMEISPLDGAGGGVLDVAAFALRLAALTLARPSKRKLMVLDEPFRFVSRQAGYRDRVRELIESLADEMGVQFVIVTHMDELRIGDVVELSL
jgi:DNA repair exonuclease SbcCD ATPase subunit